jgi:hypothetical protein
VPMCMGMGMAIATMLEVGHSGRLFDKGFSCANCCVAVLLYFYLVSV